MAGPERDWSPGRLLAARVLAGVLALAVVVLTVVLAVVLAFLEFWLAPVAVVAVLIAAAVVLWYAGRA
ncbi:hypothetical protein DQ241_17560 [Blastococcus sp. TF02A-30]|nr:hypothetical protein DQ241_17560 [Blastococcus sp. TF02A-30]